MTDSDIIKKAMIEALKASLGIVATACRSCDISRQTHYRWLSEDEDYKQAVEDIAEETVDFVESELHKLIKSGDTTAVIFYMKTKAKKRGYIERNELTGADGKDLSQVVVFKIPDNGRNDDSTTEGVSRKSS